MLQMRDQDKTTWRIPNVTQEFFNGKYARALIDGEIQSLGQIARIHSLLDYFFELVGFAAFARSFSCFFLQATAFL